MCGDMFESSSWTQIGFWYDFEENDHKLVRMVYYEKYRRLWYIITWYIMQSLTSAMVRLEFWKKA